MSEIKIMAVCPQCGGRTSKAQLSKRGMCGPCWWKVEEEGSVPVVLPDLHDPWPEDVDDDGLVGEDVRP